MFAVRAIALCFCWLVTCSLSARVQAQARGRELATEANEEPPEYRATVGNALAEHEAGHFEEARTLMLQAHAMFPNARTLRGLGMVAFELRSYAESVRWLEQALASPVRPLEGELRGQTEALLTRARSFTGRLHVELTPATARLLLDGLEIAPLDRASLLLDVGEHALEAQAESYLPERRTVRVVGGEEQTLRLTLVPVATGPLRMDAQPLATPAEPSERRAWYRNPWLWVSVGVVVVAGAATATALALTRDHDAHENYYLGLSGEPALSGPSK